MNTPEHMDMQQCIDACLQCYRTCLHSSMHHCLEAGGNHLEPGHFRLMMSCAETCRSAAHLMLLGSEQHGALCAACEEVCEACAASCEQVGEMDECVRSCRACAESCRSMAAAALPGQLSQQSSFRDQLPM